MSKLGGGGTSFTDFIQNATNTVKEGVQSLTSQISDPEGRKNLVVMVLVPAALFFVLSPGQVLNLPKVSSKRCAELAPLPSTVAAGTGGVAGFCKDGTYQVSTGTGADTFTAAQMLKICAAQNKCNSYFGSGYTSWESALLHAFVFLVLIALVNYAVNKYA